MGNLEGERQDMTERMEKMTELKKKFTLIMTTLDNKCAAGQQFKAEFMDIARSRDKQLVACIEHYF